MSSEVINATKKRHASLTYVLIARGIHITNWQSGVHEKYTRSRIQAVLSGKPA